MHGISGDNWDDRSSSSKIASDFSFERQVKEPRNYNLLTSLFRRQQGLLARGGGNRAAIKRQGDESNDLICWKSVQS